MNWITKLNTMPVWKKYSQCNEEAYISAILENLVSNNFERFLVELGAWDGYHLSNTRYFIEQGFKAILIDGDNHGNEEVKKHFINKENIVSLLEKYECPQCFDLLCIDLDGNDIYILEEILMVGYKPSLIVAEFNPIWKPNESRAITYDQNHTWSEDDYYGFSFAAGIKMAKKIRLYLHLPE